MRVISRIANTIETTVMIEVVDSFAGIDGGRGGYWEDQGYDWYAGL